MKKKHSFKGREADTSSGVSSILRPICLADVREQNRGRGDVMQTTGIPSLNIGMVGHVDHGKTTLVKALAGVWTDRHSEEIKRGISIRLGYADATFRRCPSCAEPECFTVYEKCVHCGSLTEELRTVSFVDSPGHETLMAVMLSGAAIMDGAVLLIAASEPCPQPQTEEHLIALQMRGIKNIVIAQNKIDLVTKEQALANYNEICDFVRGTIAENAPIIPISAQRCVNIDALIQAVEETIPTPERDLSKPPRMYVARSFDVNKPGTQIKNLKGGVIGGSVIQGKFREGDEIEIRPGILVKKSVKRAGEWAPLFTTISSIMAGGRRVSEATPGGLVGIGTMLDPSLTKSDALIGQLVGKPDTLPPTLHNLQFETQLLERVVGVSERVNVESIKTGEMLMLSVGTATTLGFVEHASRNIVETRLSRPVCAETGDIVAISRKVGARWHLIGAGTVR